MAKDASFGIRQPFLAVWFWATYSTSLNLGFLTCKMGTIGPTK